MIESDVVQRITREVTLDIRPSKSDSEEEAKFRSKLEKEIMQMKKDGMVIDIPTEWPEVE